MRARGVLLTGLLMLPAWAGACTPRPPEPGVEKARRQLQGALTSSRCEAGREPLNHRCYSQYNFQATELVTALMASDPGAKVQRLGQQWLLRWPDRTGKTATVHELPQGSGVTSIDRQTAFETLEIQLAQAASQPLVALTLNAEHCRNLGLRNTAQIKYAVCGVITGQSVRPLVQVKLTFTADTSLRTYQTYEYMLFGPDCQGGTLKALPLGY